MCGSSNHFLMTWWKDLISTGNIIMLIYLTDPFNEKGSMGKFMAYTYLNVHIHTQDTCLALSYNTDLARAPLLPVETFHSLTNHFPSPEYSKTNNLENRAYSSTK